MRASKWWLLRLALVAPAVYPAIGNPVTTDNVKARLVSEADSIAPGQSIWVALELDIRDGWHTYWRNPGDSGQATQIVWTLPPGITRGRHRVDHAASVRGRPPGELRLRQARDAPGQAHRRCGSQGGRAARPQGQGELAGVCRCMHPRECGSRAQASRGPAGRRHHGGCRTGFRRGRLVQSRARRVAQCRRRRRAARALPTVSWCSPSARIGGTPSRASSHSPSIPTTTASSSTPPRRS